MTGIVVTNRPELEYAQYTGTPVRARDWYAAAGLANWLRGRGACLVPMSFAQSSIAVGAATNYNFYTKNRGSCIERVWIVTGYASTTDRSATVEISDGGVAQDFTFGDRFSAPAASVFYVRQVASRSTSRGELRLTISNSGASTSAVVITGIACYEQDRPILQNDSTEGGVELYSCSTKQPIYVDDYRSANAVERVMLTAGDARRIGLFHWTRGDDNPVSNATETPQTLLALGAPVLARKIGTADTTNANIYWSAKCYATGGGSGRLVLTHTNNAGTFTDTVDFSGATSTWLTPRNITNFDCEDLSASDGRRSSAWDLVNFTLRTVSASEFVNAFVESISIWEE